MGCPKCNNDDVEQVENFTDVDDETISISMKCNKCGINFGGDRRWI